MQKGGLRVACQLLHAKQHLPSILSCICTIKFMLRIPAVTAGATPGNPSIAKKAVL
jgi:hypothetical protein